jgi:hypothetical protein
MLITHHDSQKPPIRGQTYLNLGSAWTIFDSLPPAWPEREEDLPQISTEEELATLCRLRETIITDIFLGDEQPHLIMQLADGRFFFLNGHNDTYESWQLGVATYSDPGEMWMVVACPAGGVAVWAPENFP